SGTLDTKSANAPSPSGSTKEDASAPAPAGPAKSPAQPACSAAQGTDACYACCEDKHPGAAQVWDTAVNACICGTAACATECEETLCAATPVEPVAGDACSTCIAGATECETTADTACAANAGCTAFMQCVEASGCEPEVPEVDAGE
ncbi:MAG TPA: hypothetical protein VM925_00190, partial [Labilithrix sp.]|nr:hypothetical protein [Labilithrix sp.]